MKTLFISATNTNIGKTYVATLISKYCNQKGIKTIVVKPIETGDDRNSPLDCHIHLENAQKILPHLCLEDINFYRYALPASPFVAQLYEKNAPRVDFDYIASRIKNLSSKCDLVIVEGAGGLMVPIDSRCNMFDLAVYLNAPILLISGDRLGMINDLVLNNEFLKTKNIPYTYAINIFDFESFAQISKPYIDYLNTIWEKKIYILQNDIEKIITEIFFSQAR